MHYCDDVVPHLRTNSIVFPTVSSDNKFQCDYISYFVKLLKYYEARKLISDLRYIKLLIEWMAGGSGGKIFRMFLPVFPHSTNSWSSDKHEGRWWYPRYRRSPPWVNYQECSLTHLSVHLPHLSIHIFFQCIKFPSIFYSHTSEI